MDLAAIKLLAAYGMNTERSRVEAAGLNLARANQPIRNGQDSSIFFAQVNSLGNNVVDMDKLNSDILTSGIESQTVATREVYMPNSINADSHGMVRYPDIDVTQQLIDVSTASRAYEANIRIYNSVDAMSKKILEIGSR